MWNRQATHASFNDARLPTARVHAKDANVHLGERRLALRLSGLDIGRGSPSANRAVVVDKRWGYESLSIEGGVVIWSGACWCICAVVGDRIMNAELSAWGIFGAPMVFVGTAVSPLSAPSAAAGGTRTRLPSINAAIAGWLIGESPALIVPAKPGGHEETSKRGHQCAMHCTVHNHGLWESTDHTHTGRTHCTLNVPVPVHMAAGWFNEHGTGCCARTCFCLPLSLLVG